jgi:hypothetical protein
MYAKKFINAQLDYAFPKTAPSEFGPVDIKADGEDAVLKIVGPTREFAKDKFGKVKTSVLVKDDGVFQAAVEKLQSELLEAAKEAWPEKEKIEVRDIISNGFVNITWKGGAKGFDIVTVWQKGAKVVKIDFTQIDTVVTFPPRFTKPVEYDVRLFGYVQKSDDKFIVGVNFQLVKITLK